MPIPSARQPKNVHATAMPGPSMSACATGGAPTRPTLDMSVMSAMARPRLRSNHFAAVIWLESCTMPCPAMRSRP